MKNYITIILTLLAFCLNVGAQEKIKGRVVDAQSQEPLAGATIKVLRPAQTVMSNSEGYFELTLAKGNYQLSVQYLGYTIKEQSLAIPLTTTLLISLTGKENTLQEVNVVSTGYQTLPKERATGSFTQIDQQLLNRNVGVNILDRLEAVASGLLLNRGLPTQGGANNAKIAVRGRSTLFANAEPLIVLDGFPYDGNIDQINPADIANINILKDAAAASIWGTRASNGVIVLTSKQGANQQKLSIEASTTISVSPTPELYSRPQISAADYMELEQFLFAKGYYNAALNRLYQTVSPAVEIFSLTKAGKINAADSAAQINALKGYDVRKDLEAYVYRPSLNQQYHLNLRGGSAINKYYLSVGYDENAETLVANSYQRLVLNARNSFNLIKDRLNVYANININSSKTKSNVTPYAPYTPYDRLVDEHGNALSVVNANTLREKYTDTAGRGRLLDWKYRPKEEMGPNALTDRQQYKLDFGLDLKLINGLNLSSSYQYLKEDSHTVRDYPTNSFYTRNLINRYAYSKNNIIYNNLPYGGIIYQANSILASNIVRTQLNFNKDLGKYHTLNAIVGLEFIDSRNEATDQTLYGYDYEMGTNSNNLINPSALFPYYYEPGLVQQIPTAPGFTNRINITNSYYLNFSYTFSSKYILSGSARKDESNLFGVKSNQKGVPLWSTGVAWLIDQENFYKIDWLPNLKLRATFGYNGNLDKSVSGYLTIRRGTLANEWGSVYSSIVNPPNPYLGWEKVKTYNLGIDYRFKSSRITGSIDFYLKNATDLIGNSPIAMQSGVLQFRGNSANLQTKGIDVLINAINLKGNLKWNTSLLFNYNLDKVTTYKIKQTSNSNIVNSNFNNPLEGYPYYAIFSFPYRGLDALGAPQGIYKNETSKSYSAILNLLDPSQLKYHGTASPTHFGSLINTFSFKQLELSFNLSYKFNYYFRETGVFNGSSYDFAAGGLTYYEKRWQKPGDELHTQIPALTYPANSAMGTFFRNTALLVHRGDHIRLQDIRLAYQHGKPMFANTVKRLSLFCYAKNIGILWRKNTAQLDPDLGSSALPIPLNVSFGINLTL